MSDYQVILAENEVLRDRLKRMKARCGLVQSTINYALQHTLPLPENEETLKELVSASALLREIL